MTPPRHGLTRPTRGERALTNAGPLSLCSARLPTFAPTYPTLSPPHHALPPPSHFLSTTSPSFAPGTPPSSPHDDEIPTSCSGAPAAHALLTSACCATSLSLSTPTTTAAPIRAALDTSRLCCLCLISFCFALALALALDLDLDVGHSVWMDESMLICLLLFCLHSALFRALSFSFSLLARESLSR